MKPVSIFHNSVRGIGALMLVLGLIIWTGSADILVPFHILLGLLLVIALFGLCFLAARAGVSAGLVVLVVVWTLIMPVVGLTQEAIFPGDLHWLVQVLHLILGVGAIGLAERLARGIKQTGAATGA